MPKWFVRRFSFAFSGHYFQSRHFEAKLALSGRPDRGVLGGKKGSVSSDCCDWLHPVVSYLEACAITMPTQKMRVDIFSKFLLREDLLPRFQDWSTTTLPSFSEQKHQNYEGQVRFSCNIRLLLSRASCLLRRSSSVCDSSGAQNSSTMFGPLMRQI